MFDRFILKSAALAALAMSWAAPAYSNTVITFDDLPGIDAAIPNGYKGLTWTNFNFLDVPVFTPTPSGYRAGLTSGRKVGYSGFTSVDEQSIRSLTAFQLHSFQLTAAWFDDIQVTVLGRLNGVDVFSQILSPSATAPTLYDFGGVTVDSIVFVSDFTIGTPNPAYQGGCCYQFAVDDLTVAGLTAVPEPESWAMMVIGFGLAGGAIRARRSAMPRA